MTRFPYDEFTKEYFRNLLQSLGTVETSEKVKSEIREIDVYFQPKPQPSTSNDKVELGLLGKFASTTALFEVFRNAARVDEIRSCISKQLDIIAKFERQAKAEKRKIKESDLPLLWIITPTASKAILKGFNATSDVANWGKGVYFLGDYFRTAIISIHHLPMVPETLWLRLLGQGKVQQQAIDELKALSVDNPLREDTINLLLNLKSTLELEEKVPKEDEILIMQLSAIYEQKLAEAKQEAKQEGLQEGLQVGRQEGRRETSQTIIENILQARFGSLDDDLRMIVEPLLVLSASEFTPLLLQLSRSELLARFRQQIDQNTQFQQDDNSSG